jgi:hypothetical protein
MALFYVKHKALDWLLVLNQFIPRHPETDRAIKHEIKGTKSIVINRKLMLLCYRNCQSSVTFRTKRESWRTKERPWERRLLPYRPHPQSYKANCGCVTKQKKKKAVPLQMLVSKSPYLHIMMRLPMQIRARKSLQLQNRRMHVYHAMKPQRN